MSKKPSRASTPHRLTRSSNILPSPGIHYPIEIDHTPLEQVFLPSIVELNDNLVDLDSNIQSIQSIHESLSSFNESFASFLYGLQINAYTVEFNEIPNFAKLPNDEILEKIHRLEEFFQERNKSTTTTHNQHQGNEGNDTYLTNDEDGSFLEEPKQQRRPVVSVKRSHSSRIPIGKKSTSDVAKPTVASARKQRLVLQKDKRPPFR